MSEKIFYRQERALSSHFPRLHVVHCAIFSDFSQTAKKVSSSFLIDLSARWYDTFVQCSRAAQGFRLRRGDSPCNEKVKPHRCSVKGLHGGQPPLLLELSPIYPLFIPKSFTDTPLYPQPRPTKNAVKRHASSHCPPRGMPMPFGTSTKERLCTEMNNYPQNANIRHHFLVICKRIHKPRRGWTTSVDNPVDSVDNLRSYAVCQGKIGKKHCG